MEKMVKKRTSDTILLKSRLIFPFPLTALFPSAIDTNVGWMDDLKS
jgi:hypothetical protein